ncbi:hypothetical protein [Saccharopolyspora shandongensis]|uniref:hypothetical protein n=1 Tax=Saccharopolyspora shandongensis TaxID=418495 RepID=UPI0034015AB9
MAIPYNLLPIEAHMAMITAEQANVAVLTDAARMWTEVRSWIEEARVELHTRAGELSPQWKDDAGRAHEEKVQRSLAELTMWADRIDAAQPVETLTTLAGAIPEALGTVTGLYESYMLAMSNPLTMGMAPAFQQAAGARMSALGAQFDMSMLKVVAASGLQSPGDVLPAPKGGLPVVEGSPSEFLKAANAGMDVLSELQNLASSMTDGATAPDVSGATGPSLAGATPVTGPVPNAHLGAGLPSVSGPPVPSGGLGWAGAAGGAGMMPLAKPVAGKRAPSLAAEVKPGTAAAAGTKPVTGAMPPPMIPPSAGQGAAGTLRPGSAEQSGGRTESKRKPAGTDGVPESLRGRSGGDAAFHRTSGQRTRDTDSGPSRLLEDELWQVNPPTRRR